MSSCHSKSPRKRGASQVAPIAEDESRMDSSSSQPQKKRTEMDKLSPTPTLTTAETPTAESETKPIEISTGSAPTVVSINSSSTEHTKAPDASKDVQEKPISIESDELSAHADKDDDKDDSALEDDGDDDDCDSDLCSDSEICCANCGMTEQDLEEETVKHIEAFVATDKDKHHVDVELEALTGPENWKAWSFGIGILLRMQQVWPVVDDEAHFEALDDDHELYVWSERMIDVAIAVIYANVSQRVRTNMCFMHSVWCRDPKRMMRSLSSHFGDGADDDHDH